MWDNFMQGKFGALCLSVLSVATAAAGRADIKTQESDWLLSGGLGYYYNTKGSESSRVEISAIETDSLLQNSQQQFPLLNLSLKRKIKPIVGIQQLRIGPSLYYHHVKFEGSVLQFMVPAFNNYTYTFSGDVVDGLIEVEALFKPFYKNISLVVIAGFGASYASVEYSEVARPGIPIGTSRSTPKHSDFNFVAEAGVGISKPFHKNLTGGIHYLYQYRGNADTPSQSINQNLLAGVVGRLNTQNLMLTVSRHLA